jgi:glycosyltransferase involved in cell wall biosynthesis
MKQNLPRISVVIPARNEAALISSTVASVIRARDRYHEACRDRAGVEIIVVDNASDDGTADALAQQTAEGRVLVANCEPRGAAMARNLGARLANGRVLVFLDADTQLPPGALVRIAELVDERGFEAGITRLGALDGGWRARFWWAFWNAVRLLPLPRAKAMPAFMFCTRGAFDEFGPFDERVALGEEWPILAGLYRARPRRFVYDRATTALSSARRMEFQHFGYTRTFARYVWAVLSFSGRVGYPDHIRHAPQGSTARHRMRRRVGPSLKRSAQSDSPWLGLDRWPAWLGRWLGKVRLHVIECRHDASSLPKIAKRRRWFGPLLIGPVNLYLRLLEANLRVLPWAEWHTRERTLHRVLHAIELESSTRSWLTLPRWPGVVLADYARSPIDPASARLRGLAAATCALRDLHLVELRGADGVTERLSHGDATLRNVLFDPLTGAAHWFDFDTAHDPGLVASWRHGDDLRAMLYSAVESFVDVPVAHVLRTIWRSYADPDPWEQLRDRLARGALHQSPLHFAQACPPTRRRRDLESLLLRDDWRSEPVMEAADGRSIG